MLRNLKFLFTNDDPEDLERVKAGRGFGHASLDGLSDRRHSCGCRWHHPSSKISGKIKKFQILESIFFFDIKFSVRDRDSRLAIRKSKLAFKFFDNVVTFTMNEARKRQTPQNERDEKLLWKFASKSQNYERNHEEIVNSVNLTYVSPMLIGLLPFHTIQT